ncbi:MAG: alkaline phosphatase family protein [Microcoleaceae cyanobacterium MO_207.B10]|nr:alkaline phosphatase family protein [Microcoleaceae cyanobacterium MO_207.B10]
MKKTTVINVVGLTPNLIGEYTPRISEWMKQGKMASVKPVLPAVTCSAQTTYLTGKYPNEHGIVANGWYFRDDCEVKFWRQSNKLVQAPKIWDIARAIDSSFTCANLFWWYNMYSTADFEVTPRPMYPADGRKIPDINTKPAQLRFKLQAELGQFPLFNFWGPNTSIKCSQWIADSAKWVEQNYHPTLSLVYLPHLDYCLQRTSTNPLEITTDLQEIDHVCGDLIDFYESQGAEVIILSEYGITPVNKPIHINRILREKGLIAVREELGKELLDAGASRAFAVADHQIAHVYINDSECFSQVREILENTEGIKIVLDAEGKQKYHLDHRRSGELVVIADSNTWFTYYYWLDDNCAPDFARTVDIHRKPGYDPVELFVNPQLKFPKLKIGLTLLKKMLGFRYLLDVIPLDATLVKGSHGGFFTTVEESPLLITKKADLIPKETIEPTEVFQIILSHLKQA